MCSAAAAFMSNNDNQTKPFFGRAGAEFGAFVQIRQKNEKRREGMLLERMHKGILPE